MHSIGPTSPFAKTTKELLEAQAISFMEDYVHYRVGQRVQEEEGHCDCMLKAELGKCGLFV